MVISILNWFYTRITLITCGLMIDIFSTIMKRLLMSYVHVGMWAKKTKEYIEMGRK